MKAETPELRKTEAVLKHQTLLGIKLIQKPDGYFIPERRASWEIIDSVQRLLDHENEIEPEEFGDILLWLAEEYRLAEYQDRKELEAVRKELQAAAAGESR